MFVLITKRVVKVNTGATAKFAPRTTNRTDYYVSGPFKRLGTAQRAVLVALGTHTCLDAQVWSEEQVRAQHAKGYSSNGDVKQNYLTEAMRLLEAAGDGCIA
jgi:hypothetical protein